MRNLFKNTLRSLKSSKVAITGLTILVFLAIGIFTLLSSTTTNVSSEYDRISKRGNLHDITINEKYNVGTIRYDFIENISAEDAWFAPSDPYVGYSTEVVPATPKLVSWVNIDPTTATKHTFRLALDIENTDPNSFVADVFNKVTAEDTPWTDPLYNYLFPVVTVTNSTATYTYEDSAGTYDGRPQSTLSVSDEGGIRSQNYVDKSATSGDMANDIATNFYNYLNDKYTTPMVNELNTDYGNKADFRQFKSLDINASPDHVYYKAVVSNPDSTSVDGSPVVKGDSVDKMNLFSGQEAFSQADWTLSTKLDDGTIATLLPLSDGTTPNVADILSYKVPSTIPAQGTDDYVRTLDKFVALAHGTTTTATYHDNFQTLAHGAPWTPSTYNWYVTSQQTEVYGNKTARFSFQWTDGAVPTTWFLDDWTSYFTVLAPQYAAKHDFKAASTDIFTKYSGWSGDSPTRANIIKWLNQTSQEDLDAWFTWVKERYKNNVIGVGVGTPYIIMGTGITADFLYPIVSIEHSIPNTNNESISFMNSSGYERLLDSWRSMPSEQYLVVKAKNGANVQNLIKEFLDFSKQNMNWPANVTNVYSATDTHNTLSAAAFRIAFIPDLVNSISIIDITLTVFILFLLLVIATTIIKKFIDNNRINIGVAQAIGIEKHKIAFSLLPFGLFSSVVGGVLGYLLGLFLQTPTLGLLGAYWTIPTATLGFSWVSLLLLFTIPFVIFVAISIGVTYTELRIKTTYLMKSGSEYRVNMVNKYAKKPFAKANIITKFRVSLAFNSIWKLIVMSMLTGMAITTIVFSWSINGKIGNSMNETYHSKNFNYAIDLYSPTTQSGQYIPADNTKFGESGWTTTTSEGINFIPNTYFQDETVGVSGYKNDGALTLTDPAYADIFSGINPAPKLAKTYYDMPAANQYAFLWLAQQDHNPLQYLGATLNDGKVIGSNTVYPTAADAVGQKYDLQYLKNRTVTKSTMDFSIGSSTMGKITNPWNIAQALMPANQLTQCNNVYAQIVQLAGMKAFVNDGDHPTLDYNTSAKKPSINLPGYITSNGTTSQVYENPYTTPFDLPPGLDLSPMFARDDNGNYSIVSSACQDNIVSVIGNVGTSNVSANFIKFINVVYSQLLWPDENGHISDSNDLAMEHDYLIRYNTVPLSDKEETYTYIDINGSKIKGIKTGDGAKIMGIKQNSDYVDLMHNKNNINNLLFKLPEHINEQTQFPVIINAYAQKKYGLSVGSTFTVNLANNSQRFDREIRGLDPLTANFKVVGVCDTYIGEEYYTSQDVANYVLDLKNNLGPIATEPSVTPHEYYPDMDKALQTATQDKTALAADSAKNNDLSAFPDPTDGLKTSKSPGVTYDTTDLYDLNNAQVQSVGTNITPYGFNGVFTKNSNGSQLLSNGVSLYSPSGLYPGNDRMNKDTLEGLLRYGANLQIASQIMGLWNGVDNPNNTELGNKIYTDWRAWMYPTGTLSTNFTYDDATYTTYASNVDTFIQLLTDTFGGNAVVSLVQNVLDKTSTQIVFNNVAATITKIEVIIISTIAIMFVMIIMLLTSLIVSDSKRLGGILKALGYRDHVNIVSFLSIYAPTIILGALISLPLSIMMNALFTTIIFNGMGILAVVSLHATPFVASLGATFGLFLICGFLGYLGLKKDKINELIKAN